MKWDIAMNKETNIENGLTWLDKALQMVEKYKIKTIFKAMGIIVLVGLLIGLLKNPTFIFDKFAEWEKKKHTEQIEWRMSNTIEIQKKLDKLMFTTNANRCVIMSLHNGLNDVNNIPYLRTSAIFETVNNVHPISQDYQNCILSLIPFSNILYYENYWCGDVEELKEIDKSLYHKLASNGCEHFCAVTIQGIDKPIGFIFLTYTEMPEHNCDKVLKEVQKTALELSVLMEIQKHYK